MIKYLVMDIDGSLTDGKIYMGPTGEAMKAFSVKDGYIFNYILKPAGVVPIVITARISHIVQRRCDELGIKEIYQGKTDKFSELKDIVGLDNIGACAYFGDDILDLQCMRPIKAAGGIVGCPADAVSEVKCASDYICANVAGNGALREFAEWLFHPRANDVCLEQRVMSAATYIEELDKEHLLPGRYSVDDNFFYLVQEYTTRPKCDCVLESHNRYVDIQYIVSGEEVMEIASVANLQIKEPYSKENDVTFWEAGPNLTKVVLKEGSCVILYPRDAHMGCIMKQSPAKVLKIVGKIRV